MEGLRAYAVLLTFLVHFFGGWLVFYRGIEVTNIAPNHPIRHTDKIFTWLYLSPYGVYLFFILSGFLICRLIDRPRQFAYGRYLFRRFLRIYPAFLLALLLAAGVLWYSGEAAFITGWNFAANVVLLNGVPELQVRPILHPTWSLFYEVVFYLVFPSVLVLRRIGVWRFPLAVVVAGLVLVYVPFLLGRGQALFLLFFAGATAARFDDRTLRNFSSKISDGLILALYLSVTTAITFRSVSDHVAIWLYGLAGSLFMVQSCFGKGMLNRLFSYTPIRRFGNVSYSFFLVHSILIYVVLMHLGPKWITSNGLLPALVVGFVTALFSWVLAAALFVGVERPYFARRSGK